MSTLREEAIDFCLGFCGDLGMLTSEALRLLRVGDAVAGTARQIFVCRKFKIREHAFMNVQYRDSKIRDSTRSALDARPDGDPRANETDATVP